MLEWSKLTWASVASNTLNMNCFASLDLDLFKVTPDSGQKAAGVSLDSRLAPFTGCLHACDVLVVVLLPNSTAR